MVNWSNLVRPLLSYFLKLYDLAVSAKRIINLTVLVNLQFVRDHQTHRLTISLESEDLLPKPHQFFGELLSLLEVFKDIAL